MPQFHFYFGKDTAKHGRGSNLLSVGAVFRRAPTRAVLYVNDGSSPCDEAAWRQLPSPASGKGAAHTFESTPAFVYVHQFAGSDQVSRGGHGVWALGLHCWRQLGAATHLK